MLTRLWARLSLMVRVTLGASLALVFASALLLFVDVERDAGAARARIDEHLASEIESLSPAIAEWAVIGDFAGIEQFLRQRVRQADIRSIGWMNAAGKSLEAIDKNEIPRAPGWFVRWVGVLSPEATRTLSIGGRNYGRITVEMTATPAQNRLWEGFLGDLAVLVLALALSIAVITIILRRGLRPLSLLTKGASDLAHGDYSGRIPRQGSPELAHLIDTFNHMSDGIAAAQGAVRDEAERLSVTLSSIGDGVIATDADGSVEFMNPVAEALTGWSAAEAAGRSILQVFVIINETTRAEVECPVGRAIREGVIIGLANHTLLIARDGAERPIADSAAPIHHTDGRIHGAVLVFRDQSAERAVADALRESETAYRGLFDGVGAAIYVQDAQGRFLDVNRAAERMYGFPRAAFIGKTPEFITAPGRNDLEALPGVVARAMAGEPQRFEFWGQRANGEVFPKEVRLVRGRYRGQEVVIASADDITERKQAESNLLGAQEMLRSAVGAARVFPWQWNVDADRLVWGVSPELLLGPPRDAESGHGDFRDLVHPEDREAFLAAGRRAMENGVPYYCEFRIVAPDGAVRWVVARGEAVRDAGGRVIRMVGASLDITERKQTESNLVVALRHLNALVEAIPDAIFLKDGESRWLITNEAAKSLFRLHEIPWEGKTEMELATLHPEFRAAHEACWLDDEKAWEAGHLTVFDEAMVGEDGQQHEFEVRKVPIFDEYDRRQALVIIGRDITERKQTEEQLRKLSLAVEQSPNCIVITGLDGSIEYVNTACARISGYAVEELLGQNPRIQQSGKTPPETYVAMWAALGQGRIWTGELINRKKDGSDYTEQIIVSPLRQPDGRVMHYVAIKQDITEHKRLTEEIERHREHLEELVAERTAELTVARSEAERLARAKSEFLANMSHELRTPLNGVLGMARIGARDNVGRASHETFVRIQDSGAHLLGVINDILDFSKLDAGKLVVERRPFALAAAIDNAVSFVSGAAREKGLAVEIEVAADLPEWVAGDAQRLQQILVNLLSNAVKFTARGEVRLRVAGNGDDIWFKVIDTGIGMSEAQVARLFLPFEQADSSTTRKYGGTGLGLAISQNLARLMGGEITVDCGVLGAGSSFTLRLPLPRVAPHLPAHVVDPAAPVERRLAGLRLLAAEDVEINRLILEDLLSHEGAHVIFAEDGQQALDRLEEVGVSAFDAVLMDVQMPVMNGLEATRRLREMAPALPVIGLTAHAFAEERDKCFASGMAEHVTKPIDADLLVAAILRHARPAGPIPTPALQSQTSHATFPSKGRESGSSPFKGEVRGGMELASSAPTAVPPAPAFAGSLVDWPGLLAQYSGRQAFVAKLAAITLSSQQETAAKLRGAAAQRDLEALAFYTHAIKGAAGNLMAQGVRELAARTEVAVRRSQQDAAGLSTELAAELAMELASAVEALLDELAARHPREQGG